MKNTMINTRVLAIILAVTFSLAATLTVSAKDEPVNPVELKYIGHIDNKPVFQLSFVNDANAEFVVVVRDNYNNVLYRDFIKGAKATKKFILNTEELGDIPVSFEISGKNIEKPVVYEVNNTSRLVQDVVVSRKN